jgi:hypothetical protein
LKYLPCPAAPAGKNESLEKVGYEEKQQFKSMPVKTLRRLLQ